MLEQRYFLSVIYYVLIKFWHCKKQLGMYENVYKFTGKSIFVFVLLVCDYFYVHVFKQ